MNAIDGFCTTSIPDATLHFQTLEDLLGAFNHVIMNCGSLGASLQSTKQLSNCLRNASHLLVRRKKCYDVSALLWLVYARLEEDVVEDMGAHLQYQANRLGIVLWRDDCLSMANNDQVSVHDAGDRLQVVSAQPPPRKRVRLESLITKSSPEEQQRIMEKFRSLSQRNKGAVDRGLSTGACRQGAVQI